MGFPRYSVIMMVMKCDGSEVQLARVCRLDRGCHLNCSPLLKQ